MVDLHSAAADGPVAALAVDVAVGGAVEEVRLVQQVLAAPVTNIDIINGKP